MSKLCRAACLVQHRRHARLTDHGSVAGQIAVSTTRNVETTCILQISKYGAIGANRTDPLDDHDVRS